MTHAAINTSDAGVRKLCDTCSASLTPEIKESESDFQRDLAYLYGEGGMIKAANFDRIKLMGLADMVERIQNRLTAGGSPDEALRKLDRVEKYLYGKLRRESR